MSTASLDELAELHIDYDQLKVLAAHLGRPVSTLYVLAPANDPFYAGAPARTEGAQWFADLWKQFGFGNGVHLRRIHYRLISTTAPVRLRDGKPYENTEECWSKL